MTEKPNHWILRLLKAICPGHLYEEIEGDLIQRFNRDVRVSSANGMSDPYQRATRRLLWNTMCFFRPAIILRNRFSVDLSFFHMLTSYFKSAKRQLLKNKTLSFINISGLTIGIASFLIIVLYVDYEASFDQFHENKHEVYRIAYRQFQNGELTNASAKNFMGLAAWLEDQFPEIDAVARFWRIPANAKFLLQYEGKLFNEAGNRIVADTTFFDVFPSLLVYGNPKTALKEKHSLVISEQKAKKIFGSEDPVGKVIESSEFNERYVVTGVLRNLQHSHLQVDFITPQDYSWDDPKGKWEGPWRYTYVRLAAGISAKDFETKINIYIQTLAKDYPRVKEVSHHIQPVTDIYLNSNFKDEIKANGNRNLVLILMGVAGVILILAWINYVNLETARFIFRAKEVGVRRIIGSGKGGLIAQFFIEYLCVNTIAGVLALGVLIASVPTVNAYLDISLDPLRLLRPELVTGSLLLFLLGLILVGIFPALQLARINPVLTLKGKFTGHVKRSTHRKALLTFQFVSSMVLLAIVIVSYTQLDFMMSASKRIDLEKIVSIINPTVYSAVEEKNKGEGGHANFMNLKNKLLQNPAISSMSSSSAIPGEPIGFNYTDLVKRNLGDPYDPRGYKLLFVDYDFVSFYNLKLAEGRNYAVGNGEDENWSTIILNEAAVRALDFQSSSEAVGQEIYFMVNNEWNKYKIVGVLEDYYHEAIKKEVSPTLFFLHHNRGQQVYYSVKMNAGAQPQETLSYIEETWKSIFPEKPFEYFFLDDYYDRQFKAERQFARIFLMFAGIAVFIASLGIFGMTLFETNARRKEISIRKILGANGSNLVLLLSRSHLHIVFFSSLVATPIVYFAAREWLSTYPVRIEMSFLFFLLPMLLMLVMIILTSGVQTLKAVRANPVDNLKYE